MDFNRTTDAALREMMASDATFKSMFEAKVKAKILDELDRIDISKSLGRGLEDMIRYMFIDDSYIYENVRDMVCNTLEDNISISFGGKELFKHDEESVED